MRLTKHLYDHNAFEKYQSKLADFLTIKRPQLYNRKHSGKSFVHTRVEVSFVLLKVTEEAGKVGVLCRVSPG